MYSTSAAYCIAYGPWMFVHDTMHDQGGNLILAGVVVAVSWLVCRVIRQVNGWYVKPFTSEDAQQAETPSHNEEDV